MNKRGKFNQIARDIKSVKIQGATNVAKMALYAYSLIPTEASKKRLLSLRPTEPMLANVLMRIKKESYKEIMRHFSESQEKINFFVYKLIKNNSVIFTHCHSTNVSRALVYSKKKRKKFLVYLTETRPLFQGRRTARELSSSGIKVTMFPDSGMEDALSGEGKLKKPGFVLLGADALLRKGVINKIGSELVARIAKEEKIPLYIVADSWKFTKAKIPIEQRPLNEIWDKAPKNVKLKNPAFEFVPEKYIRGIITEYGLMKYGSFVKKMLKKA